MLKMCGNRASCNVTTVHFESTLSIVQETMNQYWHEKTFDTKTRKCHFTRTSQHVKNYTVSKVVYWIFKPFIITIKNTQVI